MMLHQMCLEPLERILRRIAVVHELAILLGYRAPLGHRLEIEHLIPEVSSVKDHFDFLRELVGLSQREDLEELVARAEAAREDHERLREIREPEFPHEEI